MNNKQSYKELVVQLNTGLQYIQNHLRNIDQHLEKINTTNVDQEIKIALNKEYAESHFGLIWKVGSILVAIIGGLMVFILHLLGVY